MLVSSPFGSQSRTRVLLALSLIQQSYPRELSRILEIPLFAVQNAVLSLEKDGLVAVRNVGRTRVTTLNPRFFAARELAAFLDRLAEGDESLRGRVGGVRQRPRRTGKRL